MAGLGEVRILEADMLDPLSSISASPDCSHAGHNGQEIS